MRTMPLFLGLAFLLATTVTAQEYPRTELYTGFTYLRIYPGNNVNAFNAVGGLGQFQYNFNEALGFVADLGGVTNGNISAHARNFPGDQTQFQYLFGPRVTYHKAGGKFSPFLEIEVGGVHNSRSFTVPNALIPVGIAVPRGITVEPGAATTKFRSTQNAFAGAIGGGLDLNLSHALAFRPIQVDYLPTHFSPFNFSTTGTFPGFNNAEWQHNLRYSAGVTFRFGKKDVSK